MKIVLLPIPEPKIALTDLYAKGKKIKTENGYTIDHSQPRATDRLVVYKGQLYYEWIDDDGKYTFQDKSVFDHLMSIDDGI